MRNDLTEPSGSRPEGFVMPENDRRAFDGMMTMYIRSSAAVLAAYELLSGAGLVSGRARCLDDQETEIFQVADIVDPREVGE